jgi:lycopene cyclase domain
LTEGRTVRHLTYLGLLAGCLLGTAPLEIWLRTRVYARTRRWVLAVLPTFVLFAGWDLYAIAAGHWSYRREWMSGVVLPGGLPLEEALFFVVVPTCAILAFEAVRAVKGWPAGDEPDPPDPPGRAVGTPTPQAEESPR